MPILFSTVESRSKYDLSFKLQSQIKTNFLFFKTDDNSTNGDRKSVV